LATQKLLNELINIFILDISIVAFSKNIEKNFDRQIKPNQQQGIERSRNADF